jgi:peptidyl-Asp metalloendopeptidase
MILTRLQKLFCLMALLGGMIVCQPSQVKAQTDGNKPLFAPVDQSPAQTPEPDPAVVRSRYVSANLDALEPVLSALANNGAAADLLLPLFDDAQYLARFTRREKAFSTGWILSGMLANVQGSEVILSTGGDGLSLSVTLPGKSYTVRAVSARVYRVVQRNPRISRVEWDPLPPPGSPSTGLSAQGGGSDDDGSRIDVMVVYTPQARMESFDILNDIQTAVALANEGYENSGINQRLRLVHAAEVNYDETGHDFSSILDHLTYSAGSSQDLSGFLDEVQQMRDAYNADLVSLVVTGGDWCGLGWLMTPDWISTGFAPYGYSVIGSGCLVGSYTLTHEMGHNMGAQHNRQNASGGGAFPYSYGYWLPNHTYTIMAYACPSCEPINYFSNPQVSYLGIPTGVTNSEDNRLTLNNTASFVAKFRDGLPPDAPGSLSAAAGAHNQVTLTWQINSDDEAGFKIERAIQGSSAWNEIGITQAGVSQFTNSGLVCDTNYQYRVRAFSGNGYSAYSNTAQVSTQNCVPNVPANLTAVGVSPNRISLSWQDRSSTETGFRVERRSSGGWETAVNLPLNTTGALDSGLACGLDFEYRVFAVNESGDSTPSNIAGGSTWVCPPDLPAGLAADPLFQSRIALHWNSAARAVGYHLYRMRYGSDWQQVASTGSSELSFTDTGLSCAAVYFYRVEAYNESGSNTSITLTTSPRPCGPPAAPSSLSLDPRSSFSIYAQWPAVVDDATAYRLERSPAGLGQWTSIMNLGAEETSYWDFNLMPASAYDYRVFAVNSYGDSLPVMASSQTYALSLWMPLMGW